MDKVIQDWNSDCVDLFARSLVEFGKLEQHKIEDKKTEEQMVDLFPKTKTKTFSIFLELKTTP